MKIWIGVVSFAVATQAGAQTLEEFKKVVAEDAKAYSKAMFAKDIGYFERVSAKDLVSIDDNRRANRQQTLESVRGYFANTDRFESIKISKGAVSQKGKNFTWKGQMDYVFYMKGNRGKLDKLALSLSATETWQKREGKWLLVRMELKTIKEILNGKVVSHKNSQG